MTKRGNGEGNVRLREDGRWQASTVVTQADGSRKRHYVYGSSRAAPKCRTSSTTSASVSGLATPPGTRA